MNIEQHIAALIVKSLQYDLSAEEKAALDDWLAVSEANHKFFERMTPDAISARLQALQLPDERLMRQKFNIYLNRQEQIARRKRRGPLTLVKLGPPICLATLVLAFLLTWTENYTDHPPKKIQLTASVGVPIDLQDFDIGQSIVRDGWRLTTPYIVRTRAGTVTAKSSCFHVRNYLTDDSCSVTPLASPRDADSLPWRIPWIDIADRPSPEVMEPARDGTVMSRPAALPTRSAGYRPG